MTDDLISRQAAINALRDAENHAFNSFYRGLIKAHKIIADLPSIQPEIIRCKDCKWFGEAGCAVLIVDDSDKPTENDYCSFAERKTDG